ncbi:hypothetical protein PV327_010904 [Microctonus hyperodae]|uniref:Uncharacterized protein n=1 Tax=Microctonus hyperodae TaxID=165561 RepID=A0AA39C8F2_MICHY|nr:hypothetical protein PV327_010904 [Microctonus hyperodae]
MSAVCSRCKQVLSKNGRQCAVCLQQFYPSCSKIYLSYRTANRCCFNNLRLTDTTNTDMDRISITVPTSTQEVSLATINANLNPFINQQMLFNNNLNEAVNKQIKNQEDIVNRLNELSDLPKLVAGHEDRV